MKTLITNFCNSCQFPIVAIEALCDALDLLEKQHDFISVYTKSKEHLFNETGDPWERIDKLAREAGVHLFTAHQLFLIFCTEQTLINYRNRGLSETLFWDAMKDLKFKMEETYDVYGVWGVYCGPWLASLILMKCFCLGRLQFEILPSEFHYELAGHTLHLNDPVVNVHIPSFGRLGYQEVLDAYGRAAKFFAHLFPDGAVWFHCETWILYPEVNALLPAGNMKRFSEDYDIVHSCIDPNQDDRYRVFMLPPNVPVAEYPEKNTLQHNLKVWLLEGNTMGVGLGLFLWKNGKIESNKALKK